jgi:hypothetical protein
MQPFLVALNPKYTLTETEGMSLRDVDRERLARLMVAYGKEPVKVMGDERQVVIWFDAGETEEFESKYLSNKQILLDWRMVVYAEEWWNDLIVLWKSKKGLIERSSA